jgi:hypothetical protein
VAVNLELAEQLGDQLVVGVLERPLVGDRAEEPPAGGHAVAARRAAVGA